MKRYKATWVGENPFEGDLAKSCFQVVEVSDDMTIEELERFAREKTPIGYIFQSVEETIEEVSHAPHG
jgi:hypothetical protein